MANSGWKRDPLSENYDPVAYSTILRAIRSGRRAAAVRVWIASPSREFRDLDKGGLTRHERAFVRACYHLIFNGPRSSKDRSVRPYALKMPAVVAGPVPQRPGVMVRQLRLRVFVRADAEIVTGETSYIDNLAIHHYQGEEAV